MKTSILSLAHCGVVPSVCDAEAGETQHDAAAGIDLGSVREQAWPSPESFGQLEMKVHWYTFWKRSSRRAMGRSNVQ